jgi:hypothetical protein
MNGNARRALGEVGKLRRHHILIVAGAIMLAACVPAAIEL